jgi:hypothetical protein
MQALGVIETAGPKLALVDVLADGIGCHPQAARRFCYRDHHLS